MLASHQSRPEISVKPASVVAALAIAVASMCGWAQQPQGTLKEIIDRGTIRLGYLKDLAPFSFIAADGKPTGYSIELCQRVVSGIRNDFSLALLDIEWVELTSGNRFQRVADGAVDLECAASAITLERFRQVDFSAVIWVDSKTFLVKRGQPVRTHTDLAGKRVAVAAGTTTEKALREVLLGQVVGGGRVTTEVVLVKDRQEGFDALVRGSVDALASDRMVLAGLVRTTPAPELVLADYQFSYEPYALTLRRNDADFRLAVNQVLARLYRSGAIKEIQNRWVSNLGPLPPLLDSLYELNGLRD
jgi:glutamate/aspartate transport system substrate-binding protein